MRRSKRSLLIYAGAVLLLFGNTIGLLGSEYRAPRHPAVPQVKSPEELLDIARVVVRNTSRREALRPGYGVKRGEKILMVISDRFSPLVRDALAQAIREAGGILDILIVESRRSGQARRAVPDGSVEARGMLEPTEFDELTSYTQKIMAVVKADRYDLVIEGGGGPQPVSPFRWERIPWDTVEKFYAARFPGEVQDLIDRKVWDAFENARRIRITDPEGTDITWSVTPAHLKKLYAEFQDPIYPPGTYDIVKRGHLGLTPHFLVMPDIDATGVVAGTLNHTGAFPRTKLHLQKGKIVRVEGGGSYGENIQAVLKKYENVQYPGFPDKGVGWFIEAALGSNPKVSRVTTVGTGESTTWERGRSGVIHFGFGVSIPVTASFRKEYYHEVKAQRLTRGHFHIHNYFITIDIETRDGKTVHVVDKGRVTFLDDPEVRRVASKYGNPDELLREDWIPVVPGVSAEGNYEEYAADPAKWIARDVDQILEKNPHLKK